MTSTYTLIGTQQLKLRLCLLPVLLRDGPVHSAVWLGVCQAVAAEGLASLCSRGQGRVSGGRVV